MAQLCLLHACLARKTAGGRSWGWLSTTADSACSSALQAIATFGSTSGSSASKGKGRARQSQLREVPAVEVGKPKVTGISKTGWFPVAVVAQVCAELAAADSEAGQSVTGKFLGCSSRATLNGAENRTSPRSGPAHLRGGHVLHRRGGDWLQAFRFKLKALRNALLTGTESNGKSSEQYKQAQFLGLTMVVGEEVWVGEVGIKPETVAKALVRSRCGDAFVLAVQVIADVLLTPDCFFVVFV